jgi:hypothetical protein
MQFDRATLFLTTRHTPSRHSQGAVQCGGCYHSRPVKEQCQSMGSCAAAGGPRTWKGQLVVGPRHGAHPKKCGAGAKSTVLNDDSKLQLFHPGRFCCLATLLGYRAPTSFLKPLTALWIAATLLRVLQGEMSNTMRSGAYGGYDRARG